MIINDLFNNKKRDIAEGRFVRGPGGVPLDRQGRPVAPKAEPMRMRRWVVHHEGQRGEGGTEVIEAPNLETAWELANEYDLDIIDIKPVKGVAEGKHKCTCHPGDADPDCPVHGLEPMEVGDALDINEVSDKTLTNYLTKVDADSQKHDKDPTKRSAEKRNRSVAGFSKAFNKLDARKPDGSVKEDNAGVPVHRIGLTVTDPNHPMVSKRGETIQKTVRVPGADREKAINSAIAHYRRKGYKVHDHHYIGTVDQGVAEGAPELLKKEMPTHRHAEKLLAQNGVSKDDPDYHHHLGNTIKYLRQFGNIDLINKSDEQGVAEAMVKPVTPAAKKYHEQHKWIINGNIPGAAKHHYEMIAKLNQQGDKKSVAESMADDMAAMAQKKFPNAYISKNGQEVQKPENWGKPYTPPAAPADLEKQQRELTAKYPNIDELVRKAELNRDPNYEYADGQAYYAARDAEQNYLKLKQIQRVIQGLNESLDRSHLP